MTLQGVPMASLDNENDKSVFMGGRFCSEGTPLTEFPKGTFTSTTAAAT
jgi:hypothetical protein